MTTTPPPAAAPGDWMAEQRVAFEAHGRTKCWALCRSVNIPDEYANYVIQFRWEGWLAHARPTEGAAPEAMQGQQASKRDAWRGGDSYEASMLRNLLAVIHQDGGHYIEAHGLDKALDDAESKVVGLLASPAIAPSAVRMTDDEIDTFYEEWEFNEADPGRSEFHSLVREVESRTIGAPPSAESMPNGQTFAELEEMERETMGDWRKGTGIYDPANYPPSATVAEGVQELAESFYQHIAHGDDEHRAWLRRESFAWFSQRATPTWEAAGAAVQATPRMKLVPLEPTREMCLAAAVAAREYMEMTGGNSPVVIYRAMLAAAPAAAGAAQPVLPLTDINELAKVYASSYASPHHITFTVDGLRSFLQASPAVQQEGAEQVAPVAKWINAEQLRPEPEVFVLCWDGRKTFIEWFGSKHPREFGVTHWMPYPLPPGCDSPMHDGRRAGVAAPFPQGDGALTDAARYRWLRATTKAVISNGERIDVRNCPELWDKAIDAAIARATMEKTSEHPTPPDAPAVVGN